MTAETQRLRRKKRLDRGLCQECGERPHRPGRKTCEECAARFRDYKLRYRQPDTGPTAGDVDRAHRQANLALFALLAEDELPLFFDDDQP